MERGYIDVQWHDKTEHIILFLEPGGQFWPEDTRRLFIKRTSGQVGEKDDD